MSTSMLSTYPVRHYEKSRKFKHDIATDRPYKQLPPLLPPEETNHTLKVLKACIPVRAALADLKIRKALK